MPNILPFIHVRSYSDRLSRGYLQVGHSIIPCRLGRMGRSFNKREGDGKTPIGVFQLKRLYFRSDKIRFPNSHLPRRKIRQDMGWCDTVTNRNYNREVKLPFNESHEVMWRNDCLYDITIEISHNSQPRIKGKGSAIFFHLTTQQSNPTAGCIAISPFNMHKILCYCSPKTQLVIWPATGGLKLPRPKNS